MNNQLLSKKQFFTSRLGFTSLLKVNNRNTKARSEICSKLRITLNMQLPVGYRAIDGPIILMLSRNAFLLTEINASDVSNNTALAVILMCLTIILL